MDFLQGNNHAPVLNRFSNNRAVSMGRIVKSAYLTQKPAMDFFNQSLTDPPHELTATAFLTALTQMCRPPRSDTKLKLEELIHTTQNVFIA
jgi:hypothetical protein